MAKTSALRPIVEAIDEPALLVDGTQVIVANHAAKALLGARLEGFDVRFAIRHPHALDSILAGHSTDVEITGIGGAERAWLVAIRLVGERLLLIRLHDQAAMRAAEKMRVDFVANASHELRTPLSTILGYSETIAEDAELDAVTRSRFGGIIRTEAQRMLRIVEDLMSLSRIEADRFVAPRDLIEPEELVRVAADRARGLADFEKCRVQVTVDPDLPRIRGDEAQLLQLFDNLLANALRYGCTGEGCSVSLSASARGNSVVLTVRDEGEGIAPDHLPRLTERFYRVNEARSRDTGGTGLGLAIVKHIVQRHRGQLGIRSKVGSGTEVEVVLPAD